MNKKILLTSGCSFVFEPWNWPTFVKDELDFDLLNVGMASQGNGLISKKVIYNVEELLKKYKPEDIIVGVMWSGIDRKDFFVQDYKNNGNIDGWIENPTHIIEGHNNWLITNFSWKIQHAQYWYQHFHSHVGSMVETIERVLYTQWYLEKNNIKYFMSSFLDIFHGNNANFLLESKEVDYLYKQINFDTFLPVKGCHEWVKENYGDKGGFNEPDNTGYIGIHPTEFGHQKFANEIIVPFIKDKILNEK